MTITTTEEKYVVVPQSLLDKLEVARKELYAMYPSNIHEISTDTLMKLTDISNPMWLLVNTKWKEVDK